jgi:hypothetical protein
MSTQTDQPALLNVPTIVSCAAFPFGGIHEPEIAVASPRGMVDAPICAVRYNLRDLAMKRVR